MSNMPINLATAAVLTLGILAMGSPGLAQPRDAEERDAAAETAARQALETFITQWNTGDDANLREAMHFPFATVPGGGALIVDAQPEDFSAGFDQIHRHPAGRPLGHPASDPGRRASGPGRRRAARNLP